MKILTVGNFGTSWDGSICDEEHIAKSLEYFGHEVIRLQRGSSEQYSEADFTLIAQWDGYPDEFLESLPRPIVYWAFDYQAEHQPWHEKLVDHADLYLSKRLADGYKYSNWRWLSQDFAPDFLDHPQKEIKKQYDVVFTGSYLPWAKDRIEILKAVDKDFDLHIFTVTPNEWTNEGFANVHPAIVDQGLPELYAKCRVVISIDHTIEAGYWSDRNAQAMACGAFVLFKYVPLSEVAFHNKLAYFHNYDQCRGALNYFLEVDEDRDTIAFRGYEYAHEHLMVNNRVADMLTIVSEIL